MVKAIVLRAAGTNCDYETRFALKHAGFEVDDVHINELALGKKTLSDYKLLAIPGGFSAGDYLGSGKVYANKLLYKLHESIPDFIREENLVLGICNGFQVLVKAGILPGFSGNYRDQQTTLTLNQPSGFRCEWVKLKTQDTVSVFTKGID
ncbi:MAG: phosphoribosylformylglycinamidine synthase subunit PurQ, partial [archaeon]|nr:phosphoribosylformylglycinamidine synthase subunit PurQ [archaeon]